MSGSGPERIGDYEILEELGHGSRGRVFKARCVSAEKLRVALHQTVAVKVLHPTKLDDRRTEEFKTRSDVLRRISHPNIVCTLDAFVWHQGEWDEACCVVSELLEGETMAARLSRAREGLDWAEMEPVFRQVLAALVHARSFGAMHGNIKPSNIFLSASGVKLIDFDVVSRDECGEESKTAGWKGSFDYMAPDFVRETGFRGDEKSDIFSIGVCFFEALTGRLPFDMIGGEAHAAFINRWHPAQKKIPQPSFRAGPFRVLAGARRFAERALEVEREKRFASFLQMEPEIDKIYNRLVRHSGGDEYELQALLGQGGFGEVFLAQRVRDGLKVAVKHLFAAQQSDRFIREAQILQRCKNQYICKHIDFFAIKAPEGDQYYLVMEYLDGMPGWSLRNRIRNDGALPVDEVVPLFINYLRALQFLHEGRHPIIHRDLKPANLYAPKGHPELGRIFDLGIARDVSATATTGSIPGTLDYMAPEFAMSGAVRGTPRTDIYSMGLCLFEAVSGKPAYEKLPTSLVNAWLSFQKRAESGVPIDFNGSVFLRYPRLAAVIRNATAVNPEERTESARDMIAQLEGVLHESAEDDSPTIYSGEAQSHSAITAKPFDRDAGAGASPVDEKKSSPGQNARARDDDQDSADFPDYDVNEGAAPAGDVVAESPPETLMSTPAGTAKHSAPPAPPMGHVSSKSEAAAKKELASEDQTVARKIIRPVVELSPEADEQTIARKIVLPAAESPVRVEVRNPEARKSFFSPANLKLGGIILGVLFAVAFTWKTLSERATRIAHESAAELVEAIMEPQPTAAYVVQVRNCLAKLRELSEQKPRFKADIDVQTGVVETRARQVPDIFKERLALATSTHAPDEAGQLLREWSQLRGDIALMAITSTQYEDLLGVLKRTTAQLQFAQSLADLIKLIPARVSDDATLKAADDAAIRLRALAAEIPAADERNRPLQQAGLSLTNAAVAYVTMLAAAAQSLPASRESLVALPQKAPALIAFIRSAYDDALRRSATPTPKPEPAGPTAAEIAARKQRINELIAMLGKLDSIARQSSPAKWHNIVDVLHACDADLMREAEVGQAWTSAAAAFTRTIGTAIGQTDPLSSRAARLHEAAQLLGDKEAAPVFGNSLSTLQAMLDDQMARFILRLTNSSGQSLTVGSGQRIKPTVIEPGRALDLVIPASEKPVVLPLLISSGLGWQPRTNAVEITGGAAMELHLAALDRTEFEKPKLAAEIPAAGHGIFRISVTPKNARLILDDKEIQTGDIPVGTDGKHKLRAEAEGYQTYEQSYRANEGKIRTIDILLEPARGR